MAKLNENDFELEARIQVLAFRIITEEGWPEDNDLDAIFERARSSYSGSAGSEPTSEAPLACSVILKRR